MKSKDAKPGMVLQAVSRWDRSTYVVADPPTETFHRKGRYGGPPVTRTVILGRILHVQTDDYDTGEPLPERCFTIGHVVKVAPQTVTPIFPSVEGWWSAEQAEMAADARLKTESAKAKAELESLAARLRKEGFESATADRGHVRFDAIDARRMLETIPPLG